MAGKPQGGSDVWRGEANLIPALRPKGSLNCAQPFESERTENISIIVNAFSVFNVLFGALCALFVAISHTFIGLSGLTRIIIGLKTRSGRLWRSFGFKLRRRSAAEHRTAVSA